MSLVPENFEVVPAFSLETLAKKVIDDLSAANDRAADPMVAQTILVMNPAQGTWLRQFIAEHSENHICANVNFESPDNYFNNLLENLRGNAAGTSAGTPKLFRQGPLAWRIFKALRERKGHFGFSFRGNDECDLLVLAESLANLFWSYQTRRPEMICAWQGLKKFAKDDEKFADGNARGNAKFAAEYRKQRELWSALKFENDEVPAVKYLDFLAGTAEKISVPAEIFIFAPTAITRIHFEMLAALSRRGVKIHFYYHNLSNDLWIETENEKTRLKKALEKLKGRRDRESLNKMWQSLGKRERVATDDDEKWTASIPGNELLISWGRAARKLRTRLLDENLLFEDDKAQPPEGTTILERIQKSVRGNENSSEKSENSENSENSKISENSVPADDSLKIHEAHSPLREMEILYDDLFELFTRDTTLTARDVIVMMPNVEDYAQAIHAVFGAENSAFPRYFVNDRQISQAFPCIQAFMAILRLIQGDLRASSLAELFNCQAICDKFSIDRASAKRIIELIKNSNFRSGFDAGTRERAITQIFGENAKATERTASEGAGVPSPLHGNATTGNVDALVDGAPQNRVPAMFYRNSFAFARRRMILGLATSDEPTIDAQTKIFPLGENGQTIAPLGKIGLDDAEEIEKMLALVEHLRKLNFEAKEKKTPSDWQAFLERKVLDFYIDFRERDDEKLKILSAIREVTQSANDAKFSDECDFATFAVQLQKNIDSPSKRAPEILRGGITFCAMQPMRNITSKVICVAGLSAGAFPRQNRSRANDLTRLWHKNLPGGNEISQWDRLPRDEDCLLLLEAFLAAKKYLRFSFVGNSQADGKSRPPCAPLSKFLDFLANFTGTPRERWLTKHALQNFEETGTRNLRIARLAENLAGTEKSENSEISENSENSENSEEIAVPAGTQIDLRELISFFDKPLDFLARELAKIKKPFDKIEKIDDLDPFWGNAIESVDGFGNLILRELENGATCEDENLWDLLIEFCNRAVERACAAGTQKIGNLIQEIDAPKFGDKILEIQRNVRESIFVGNAEIFYTFPQVLTVEKIAGTKKKPKIEQKKIYIFQEISDKTNNWMKAFAEARGENPKNYFCVNDDAKKVAAAISTNTKSVDLPERVRLYFAAKSGVPAAILQLVAEDESKHKNNQNFDFNRQLREVLKAFFRRANS